MRLGAPVALQALALAIGMLGLSVGAKGAEAIPVAGSPWQRYDLSGSDFQAVDGISSDTVWAAGSDGLLAPYKGSSWQQISAPAVTGPMVSVDAVDSNNAQLLAGALARPPMGRWPAGTAQVGPWSITPRPA